jgi:hypothetical protein
LRFGGRWALLWAEWMGLRRGFGRLVAGELVRSARRTPAGLAGNDSSVLLHEDERAFHVHGGGDELKVAGVAGEPAIAERLMPYLCFIVA